MPTLIVSAKPVRGRYRAGIHFTREQSIVEVDAEQEAAIRADSALVVHEDKPAQTVESTEDAEPARESPKSKRER